jgi:uncharacterized repeat protein (TIGR03803 family)
MNPYKIDNTENRAFGSASAVARRCTLRLMVAAPLLVAAPWTMAQTESVLYSFTGGADGGSPSTGLVLDAKGNFYGTTPAGGLLKHGCGTQGCGTVFELTPSGVETVLHTFTGTNDDGKFPDAPLLLDPSGNLYGTTVSGGANKQGTVFELTPTGTETVLYAFTVGADGASPGGGLVRDAKLNLYGTTISGGHYDGTVFELTPSGAETVLFTFDGQDGEYPATRLLRAAGNLYGTVSEGGGSPGCAPPGCGLIFEVTSGGIEGTLYTFTGAADGARPAGALLRDAQGNLYGTAAWGGTMNSSCPQGCGTVYEVSPAPGSTWSLTVLHSFTGEGDGYHPVASLVRDAKGNLYGITSGDACLVSACSGTVFEITAAGVEKVLYIFTGGADGGYPYGDLVRDKKGNLYGTTQRGGAFNEGAVFKVTP